MLFGLHHSFVTGVIGAPQIDFILVWPRLLQIFAQQLDGQCSSNVCIFDCLHEAIMLSVKWTSTPILHKQQSASL